MDESLVQFLATHDAPCPKCGYTLRSVESPTCPECGLQLEVALLPNRQSATPWCALLVAVSLLSGVGFRRWVGEAFHGLPSLGAPSLGIAWYWYVLQYAILASPLFLIAVLLGRHWLMRRRTSVQWGLGGLAVAIFALESLSLMR